MSILRSVLLEMGADGLPEGALDAACLLVQRAGLPPFGPDEEPTFIEVQALANAKEMLVKEHTALAVAYFLNPSLAFKSFDGGRAQRAEMMAECWKAVGLG